MSNTFSIYHSDLILTADGYQLGQAVRLYHRRGDINPKQELFPHYLMVANLEIGDEFYVPLHYITTHDAAAGTHTLNLTLAEIKKEQLTILPRFIAFEEADKEELTQPPADRTKPEAKKIETTPLPPKW